MTKPDVPKEVIDRIEVIVRDYSKDLDAFDNIATAVRSLLSGKALRPLIHSIKVRVKEPSHLREKLIRKYIEVVNRGDNFDIDGSNLYERITDLVGARIIHLHTRQFYAIHNTLVKLLDEELYEIVEGPTAKYWDNEYKAYFESIGISVDPNPRLYTSVHYTVKPTRKTSRRVEIQVRTLAEELWGEVDHVLNYPNRTDSVAVSEQLLVLARVTSSCTRLVDSVFKCANTGSGEQIEKDGI